MITRSQARRLLLPALVACILAGSAVFWFKVHRIGRSSDLVTFLPTQNATIVYIDVDALRRSGMLQTLAGSKPAEESDYLQFVRETDFDYTRDLDAVAAAFKDGRTYFAVRGRFHWKDLTNYAIHQDGSCHDEFCVLSGSRPNRRISFFRLRADLMALAVGPDDFAAYKVSNGIGKLTFAPPAEPVWASVPTTSFQHSEAWPAAVQAFLPALKGAEQIVFSVGADSSQQLKLDVHITSKDSQTASALLAQLEGITKTMRDAVARQRQKPGPADLTGVLLAGSFHRNDRQVDGAWPIPKEFVSAIAGNSY